MSKTNGTLFIRNWEIFARVGILPEELVAPQLLRLTLKMRLNTGPASRTGNIQDTLDYAGVYSLVSDKICGKHWGLIETLAEEIATWIIQYKFVSSVKVEIEKPNALPGTATAGIRIRRTK